jgi:hypothetical protein
MTKKQSNYMGDYEHLIRVNGRRSVLGTGHTRRESVINALDCAAETFPHNAHIFGFLKARTAQGLKP